MFLAMFGKLEKFKLMLLHSVQRGRYTATVLIMVLLAGCVSTPEVSSLPPPDVSSGDIDSTIRRPVPVYEFPDQGDENVPEGETPPDKVEALPLPPTYSDESTSTSRTVLALLTQASKQQRSGSPERAAATLERALRIEPKNARLWHRLAQIRFQQGQYSLAESLAAKSSTLARGDWHLKQKNTELIEQVRERRAYVR